MKTIKHNLKNYPEYWITDRVSFILRNPYEQSRSVLNIFLLKQYILVNMYVHIFSLNAILSLLCHVSQTNQLSN